MRIILLFAFGKLFLHLWRVIVKPYTLHF